MTADTLDAQCRTQEAAELRARYRIEHERQSDPPGDFLGLALTIYQSFQSEATRIDGL